MILRVQLLTQCSDALGASQVGLREPHRAVHDASGPAYVVTSDQTRAVSNSELEAFNGKAPVSGAFFQMLDR
jgi:hypothetical protein